jgi:cytochrome c556
MVCTEAKTTRLHLARPAHRWQGIVASKNPGESSSMRLVPAVGLLIILAAPASAQSPVAVPATTLISARQSGMDLSYAAVASLKAAVKAKEDVKTLEPTAEALAGWAQVVPTLFPPGTEKGNNTTALPAIWTDTAGFQKDAGAYQDATKKLVVAAKAGDRAGFVAAFKDMGQACGACHKGYRKKES